MAQISSHLKMYDETWIRMFLHDKIHINMMTNDVHTDTDSWIQITSADNYQKTLIKKFFYEQYVRLCTELHFVNVHFAHMSNELYR